MKKCNFWVTVVLFALTTHVSLAQSDFRGSIEPVPSKIAASMIDHTWHKGCPLPISSMSYLTLTYWGFDHKPHEGHLVVLSLLAGEILQIFEELYDIKFPIEKMALPDAYASEKNDWLAIDWKSSEDNDTYSYLCREDDQTPGSFSPHSYGVALDINPKFNPSKVANNKVQPSTGKKYFDRSLQHEGMIDNKVVAIFAKHGWKWGGYWPADKVDYMHFQKDIDEHYMCRKLIPVQLPTAR